ncbi:flavin-dependent oxidoreductase [Ramlibacter henchirensis]|uniref:Flavin-dependent oxidoreductase n=1 Tax=Ramlibacter henchirensis TaxID=204072 RepID=A0A4Z0BQJ8_9BURK|nr:flavin-dependent oxidoreductase [Ramlibacter henchirensis]TFZ00518.1 flavin-dependent oxidoreductase [Ramlibacter henchirensis]
MRVAILGGGIGGLALALSLHRHGIACDVYEAVPEVREIGVGITLLPHAMREITALGLQAQIEAEGIENLESVFFNRWGQFIYREPRGRHAGYELPEIGLPRGKLHRVLYQAVLDRLGAAAVHLDRRCVGVDQDEHGVTLRLQTSAGAPVTAEQAEIAVACDGVNSAVRRQFYPDEQLAFAGINTWRGVTVHPPILTGRSYLRIGSIGTGKMVIYPIVDNVDGQGRQLVNWVAEIQRPGSQMNDWNRAGAPDDFIDLFADWRYDWLDVPALIRGAAQIFEYPMVDRDPVPRWTFGRVTLLGDAAHPMYPRGSNGSAQALIDARVLATELAAGGGPAGLARYEAQRLAPTARIVETNRSVPPDFINIRADELSGGKPFPGTIDDLISQEELRRISDEYKRIAGFALEPGTGGK